MSDAQRLTLLLAAALAACLAACSDPESPSAKGNSRQDSPASEAAEPSTEHTHDFWIEPSAGAHRTGEVIDIGLRVGTAFEDRPVRRDERKFPRFVVLGPEGVETVSGEDGKAPAGRFTPKRDGIHVVAYEGRSHQIERAAPTFETTLRDEGLDAVAKMRADRGETGRPGRETWSRCAKSLVLVGAAAADGFDRVAGLRLEIVPETNPFVAAPGAETTFLVLFEGRPLEGALVAARRRAEPKPAVTARTGADGRVKLKLEGAGAWLVRCTHMVPASPESGMDWESVWSSLTY